MTLKLVSDNGRAHKRTPRAKPAFLVHNGGATLAAVAEAVAALQVAYDARADLAEARDIAEKLLKMYAEEIRKSDALTRG